MPLDRFDAYIRSVVLKREQAAALNEHPFNVPAIRCLETLDLHPSVTFLVGENGTGKSTLLEAIAVAAGFNPEGGSTGYQFSTRDSHTDLHRLLKLIRGVRRPKDGFFLRAESFYNAATYLEREAPEYLNSYGGISLHLRSHGEAFLALLTHRFRGNGLFLLDEPEAALSPLRQMTFLARVHELVLKQSQFIIATHSPIIMAYPQATIYLLTQEGIQETTYKETEHYKVARDFLLRTDAMLAEILSPEQLEFTDDRTA